MYSGYIGRQGMWYAAYTLCNSWWWWCDHLPDATWGRTKLCISSSTTSMLPSNAMHSKPFSVIHSIMEWRHKLFTYAHIQDMPHKQNAWSIVISSRELGTCHVTSNSATHSFRVHTSAHVGMLWQFYSECDIRWWLKQEFSLLLVTLSCSSATYQNVK